MDSSSASSLSISRSSQVGGIAFTWLGWRWHNLKLLNSVLCDCRLLVWVVAVEEGGSTDRTLNNQTGLKKLQRVLSQLKWMNASYMVQNGCPTSMPITSKFILCTLHWNRASHSFNIVFLLADSVMWARVNTFFLHILFILNDWLPQWTWMAYPMVLAQQAGVEIRNTAKRL